MKNKEKPMIFLIDYQNVHNTGLNGIEELTSSDRLILFLKENDTFSAVNHIKLEQAPVQREYIFVAPNTKNALDFQLVASLGLRCAANPEEEYYIVSNDQGYDAAITFLKNQGYKVTRRYNLKNLLPKLPVPKEEEVIAAEEKKPVEEDNEITNKKIKSLVPELNADKVNQIKQIANNYKTKQAIQKHLVKILDQETGNKVYHAIRPLLANKS